MRPLLKFALTAFIGISIVFAYRAYQGRYAKRCNNTLKKKTTPARKLKRQPMPSSPTKPTSPKAVVAGPVDSLAHVAVVEKKTAAPLAPTVVDSLANVSAIPVATSSSSSSSSGSEKKTKSASTPKKTLQKSPLKPCGSDILHPAPYDNVNSKWPSAEDLEDDPEPGLLAATTTEKKKKEGQSDK